MGTGILARLVLCTNARSNVCSFLGAPGKGPIALRVRLDPPEDVTLGPGTRRNPVASLVP